MDPNAILRFLQTGDPAHLGDPGMAALPGAAPVAPQTPALPFGVTPTQPTARDLIGQANAIPDAARKSPAFRTHDLIALLGTALAGKQGGQFLGSYLQQKGGIAQDDTRRAQAEVDRQRQDLYQRANFAQQDEATAERTKQFDAKLAQDTAESAADRASREKIAGLNTTSRETIAQGNNDTKLKVADYTYKGKQLNAETKKYGLDLANQSSTVKSSLATLMKLPEAARPGFARAIRQNVPELADWDDDAIQALGRSTASEEAKRAQAQEFKAQTGYYGARARNLDALTQPQRDLLIARAGKVRQDVQTEIAKAGLIEKQGNLIDQKVSHYEPEFRLKVARNQAYIQKAQGTANPDVGKQRQAYAGLLSLANQQIANIKRDHKGIPNPVTEGDAWASYQQAVQDQQDASDNLKRINKAVLNPVTQGTPTLPGHATGGAWNLPPAGPLVGGIGNAGGLGPPPGRTRSGTKYRVVG